MRLIAINQEPRRRLISGQVRRAIKKSGLTQEEAARRMEISKQYLSDIVRGKRSVGAAVAVRLEAVLGMDAHRIVVDQALSDLECARAEYRKRVAA